MGEGGRGKWGRGEEGRRGNHRTRLSVSVCECVCVHGPELDGILPHGHDVALQLLLGGESGEEEVRALGDLVSQVDLNDVRVVRQLGEEGRRG